MKLKATKAVLRFFFFFFLKRLVLINNTKFSYGEQATSFSSGLFLPKELAELQTFSEMDDSLAECHIDLGEMGLVVKTEKDSLMVDIVPLDEAIILTKPLLRLFVATDVIDKNNELSTIMLIADAQCKHFRFFRFKTDEYLSVLDRIKLP